MNRAAVPLLAVACVLSAMAVVQVAWQCRVLATQLMEQELLAQHLQTAWGQLLLEESALGALPRIEKQAQEQGGMRAPHAADFVVLNP